MSEEETNIKDDLIELTKLRAVARSEIISANSMIAEVLAKRTNTKQEEEKADNIVKGLEKVKRDLQAELKQLDCIETLLNLCDDDWWVEVLIKYIFSDSFQIWLFPGSFNGSMGQTQLRGQT